MSRLKQLITRLRRPDMREVAVAQVSDKYSEYPSNGLTPVKLAEILREADAGDVLRQMELFEISIHAPHAGRDSKSIQNYFTHFCDKRQFLDNFTQNAAFQSVLSLADRQKLLYLRCEPLRKFLRAFASHYKIIVSSGR